MKFKFLLIAISVIFFIVYAWSYQNQIQPLFAYANFSFDENIQNLYYFPCLLFSMLILFLLPNKDLTSNIFVAIIYVFVFSSIFQVSIYFIDEKSRYDTATAVIIGFALIVLSSRLRLNFHYEGGRTFTVLVGLLFVLFAVLSIREGLTSGLQVVGFSDIYALRAELELSGVGRYALSLYVFSIGPMVLAIALFHRHLVLFILAASIYVLGYLFTFQKFVLLAPILVLLIWFSSKYIFFRRPAGLILIYAMPFFIATLWVALDLNGSAQMIGLVSARMYAVPGQIFAHYVDFFDRHPHTLFSHITGVNWFVEYPYDQPIPLMIRDYYPGGNQNANFWAQDAVAGMGIWAIPAVSLIFGIVLVLVNSVSSGLDPRFSSTACSLVAQRFSDGTLATGLLSGGLMLTIFLLALAPRAQYSPGARRVLKWRLF